MAKKKYESTVVPPVHADVTDIMRALLQTPPPPAGDKSTRKAVQKKKRKRR